jgi:hypothetical protein
MPFSRPHSSGLDAHAGSRSTEASASVSAFDRWLKRQLRRIYREGLDEPTPDHLQDLVEQFPSRSEREDTPRSSKHGSKPQE